jgi:hypothetical protein
MFLKKKVINGNYQPPAPPSPMITIQASPYATNMRWALNNPFCSDVQFMCNESVFHGHQVCKNYNFCLEVRLFCVVVVVMHLWMLLREKILATHL